MAFNLSSSGFEAEKRDKNKGINNGRIRLQSQRLVTQVRSCRGVVNDACPADTFGGVGARNKDIAIAKDR